jgi:hypothetical protein
MLLPISTGRVALRAVLLLGQQFDASLDDLECFFSFRFPKMA